MYFFCCNNGGIDGNYVYTLGCITQLTKMKDFLDSLYYNYNNLIISKHSIMQR